MLELNQVYNMDCIEGMKLLDTGSINCCVTSPPYWGLRDYGVEGQIGLEATPEEYVKKMVLVFREAKRVLRDDGTLWLNLGDSYASSQAAGDKKFGNEEFNKNRPSREFTVTPEKKRPNNLKAKDLVGIPWMVAFALRADGWILRSDIIWHKPNPMPESVTDRPTKSHEYIFLLSKSSSYYYANEAIKERTAARWTYGQEKRIQRVAASGGALSGGTGDSLSEGTERNKRTVWTVATQAFSEAHFATFPPKLIEPCILAGCPVSGIVLDPFMGSGTTGMVALQNQRNYIGFELNPEYIKIADEHRLHNVQLRMV